MVKIVSDESEIPTTGCVVLDFFATWCGPCRMIAPSYEKFAELFPEYVCLKVDVDESQALVDKYDISAMPTFLFLKNGQVIKRVEGANLSAVEQGFAALGA
jgi:thioredoxin 1